MTDTVNVQLLPCPFCGGEASIERYGNTRVSTQYHCDDCGCFLETGEEFNHGRSWNTRATLAAAPKAEPIAPASDELLEALRELLGRAEEVRNMLNAHPLMQGREHVSMGVALNKAIGRGQRAYDAQHKGLQS